jgi:hypothetical protein
MQQTSIFKITKKVNCGVKKFAFLWHFFWHTWPFLTIPCLLMARNIALVHTFLIRQFLVQRIENYVLGSRHNLSIQNTCLGINELAVNVV